MKIQYKHFLFYTVLIAVIACSDDGSPTTQSEELMSSVSSSSESKKEQSSSSYKENWDYLNPEIDYGEMTDARDGQVYKTVKIGDQTWMAENLNYETDNSYCSKKYCALYGRLYSWATAMDSAGKFSSDGVGCGYGKFCSPTFPVRGVCPEGWHLPRSGDWGTLIHVVSDFKQLKSKRGWDGMSAGCQDCNGTDDFGFSMLPAGFCNIAPYGASFGGMGHNTSFWSSSEYSGDGEYSGKWLAYAVVHNDKVVYLDYYPSKSDGYSVRCVKDE